MPVVFETLKKRKVLRPLFLIANMLRILGLPFYLLLEMTLALFYKDIETLFRVIKNPAPPIPSVYRSPGRHKFRRSLLFTSVGVTLPFLGGILGIFALVLFWFIILKDLPNPSDLVRKPRPLTTKIYDRNGNLMYKFFRNQNRTYIPLKDIPLYVQQATISVEDAEFYSHPGFSVRGIARAVERNVIRGQITGGSTITQQLVKNALLTPERTLRRKFKEVILALWAELSYPKDKILEMYLNEVSFGGTAYGVEEASLLYFGKSVKNLTLGEAALLAGLPAAPTEYSPFGAKPELAHARQQIVLARMVEEGYITSGQAKEAEVETITFATPRQAIKAPHFVMWVKQLLVEKYGESRVEEGGFEITTSLDLETQNMAEQVLQNEVSTLTKFSVSNGAALVTKPETGEVVAMVGSRNYFDIKGGGNFNVTTALRQPGSSIKPVNYAYALSHGYNPSSIIDDSPITYRVEGAPTYSPQNYDSKFRGKVTLRTALASSLNVPAVRVLSSYGVDKMIEQGQNLGIASWNEPRYFGLSLTLGSGEVKMTELATVYGTLSNYGSRIDLNPILRIVDNRGKVIEENPCVFNKKKDRCGKEVLDPRVAFMLTDILVDNNARVPVFGPSSLLVIPNHGEVAVKTGTSQNLRDNWAVGYTKEYVVAAWVGNNNNRPMSRIASGITGATPIWHKIMKNLLAHFPPREHNPYWEPPEGVVKVGACPDLSCEECRSYSDWFLKENAPKARCLIEKPKQIPELQTLNPIN
mgnify:CR=1 FL=1